MPTLERWLLALVIALLVGAWHAAYAALYARPLPVPTRSATSRSHPPRRAVRPGGR